MGTIYSRLIPQKLPAALDRDAFGSSRFYSQHRGTSLRPNRIELSRRCDIRRPFHGSLLYRPGEQVSRPACPICIRRNREGRDHKSSRSQAWRAI
jgi:hypothetical protein